jgi:hypothetical protein
VSVLQKADKIFHPLIPVLLRLLSGMAASVFARIMEECVSDAFSRWMNEVEGDK